MNTSTQLKRTFVHLAASVKDGSKPQFASYSMKVRNVPIVTNAAPCTFLHEGRKACVIGQTLHFGRAPDRIAA